jgi:hypothetical protein
MSRTCDRSWDRQPDPVMPIGPDRLADLADVTNMGCPPRQGR